MTKLFSKTLTSLVAHSHQSSTTSKLSTAPLLLLSGPFSTHQTSPASLEPESSSSTTSQESKGGSKGSGILWLVAGLTSCTLADWRKNKQQREATSIMKYKQQCLEMEPMNLNTKNTLRGKDFDMLEFRKVIFRGAFDEQRSIYVGPKHRYMLGGVTVDGFNVITPLLPIPNDPNSIDSPILVNRGWVPPNWKEKTHESTKAKLLSSKQNRVWKFWSKPEEQVVSKVIPVEVVGVIRGSETQEVSVSPNDPSSTKWFYVDVPAMARAIGLDEDTIYVEKTQKDLDDHPSRTYYPVPKNDEALIRGEDIPMDHYSLAGYILSLALISKAFKIFLRKYRVL